jgi:hypothetical protein
MCQVEYSDFFGQKMYLIRFFNSEPERVPQELVRASQIPDGRMEPKGLVPERNPSLGLFVVSRAIPDREAFSNFSNRLRNLTKTEDEDRDASQVFSF